MAAAKSLEGGGPYSHRMVRILPRKTMFNRGLRLRADGL